MHLAILIPPQVPQRGCMALTSVLKMSAARLV
jgi:hypothetical protein